MADRSVGEIMPSEVILIRSCLKPPEMLYPFDKKLNGLLGVADGQSYLI